MVGREIDGSFIRFGIGLMLRVTPYTFTSRCNRSSCGRRITSFRSIAAYCAMNSRPCCNLTDLERCDGSCRPRVASISPSFWQDGYEVPAKSDSASSIPLFPKTPFAGKNTTLILSRPLDMVNDQHLP